MMPYEKIVAWRVSHELVLHVYTMTRTWPREERYGLVSQARRAALSIPSNMPEGSAKRTSREFRRFLDIAIGSLSELSYLLSVARDLEFCTHEEW